MEQIIFKPALYKYQTCQEFVDEFKIGPNDLIFTNEYIYQPAFGGMNLDCHVLYQEKYGTGEPSDAMAERILADTAQLNCQRIIAVGGGTVIDLAKVIAVSDTQNVDELYERMPVLNKMMELVIVPTTCGTGSEMTNVAVLSRTRMGTKMGLVGPAMYADSAVLIPELLASLPFQVFATSSIDALVHAVESSLSPRATPYTKLFSYRAIELIVQGYQFLAENGLERCGERMEDFLLASNYAGLAFGTAGCAAVHAMSYPLSGTYHVPHGESNYAMFIGVMEAYMRVKADGEIAVLNEFLASRLHCGISEVYKRLEELLNHILQRKTLREYGVVREDIPQFAQSVAEQQTRLTQNNFVPLSYQQILEIYQQLY